MWFTNKKWILEHCGKNEKDVRWLDRAIKKWIIWHDVEDTGAYILCTEYIEELEEENMRLTIKAWLLPGYILAEDAEKLKEIEKSDSIWGVESNDVEIKRLEEENNELRQRLIFAWERLDHANKCLTTIREKFANSSAKWSDEKFNSEFGYKMNEREVEERLRMEERWLII